MSQSKTSLPSVVFTPAVRTNHGHRLVLWHLLMRPDMDTRKERVPNEAIKSHFHQKVENLGGIKSSVWCFWEKRTVLASRTMFWRLLDSWKQWQWGQVWLKEALCVLLLFQHFPCWIPKGHDSEPLYICVPLFTWKTYTYFFKTELLSEASTSSQTAWGAPIPSHVPLEHRSLHIYILLFIRI